MEYEMWYMLAVIYKIKYKPEYRSCDLLKNWSALIGGIFVFQKKKDLLASLNTVISTNESKEFITDHMNYNPAYTYIL